MEPLTDQPTSAADVRSIVGCILGTAVGDAMGLACEGLSRSRQARMYPALDGYRFFFGKGLCSDDTEHTCMTAQALIRTAALDDDEAGDRFAKSLAWRLQFWLLGLPAGIGMATGRALIKLWLGVPARYAGVRSAGNGPAMRSGLIGVCHGNNPVRLKRLVRASTRITHRDRDAEDGAFAIALAAHLSARLERPVDARTYADDLERHLGTGGDILADVRMVQASVDSGEGCEAFAERLGCANGISGYIRHSVPAVLHVWLSHPDDFAKAIMRLIRLGGDSDTTAAMLGAIIGARVGRQGIPARWLQDLWEWPRSVSWMERLGVRLAEQLEAPGDRRALAVNPLALLLRNLIFLVIVLTHGFRRLAPPY